MAYSHLFWSLLFLAAVSPIVFWPLLISWGRRMIIWQLRRRSPNEDVAASPPLRRSINEGRKTGSPLGAGVSPFEEAPAKDWKGTIGFFHPFCNAGGGGERVLWAAIRATQQRWPVATCVVYTGDREVKPPEILKLVQDRFNIHLNPTTISFLYLSTRHWLLASRWPRFTLLGQSIGSLIVAYDAFSLHVPDIFIDTMGYAFTLAFCKAFFPKIPTGAYVHYPTISTDMLDSLVEDGQGVNAGLGRGWRGKAKRAYWRLFARIYSWVGGNVDVVMTNSSWTQGHIQQLWGPSRTKRRKEHKIEVVYPPCPVEELEKQIPVNEDSEKRREPLLICIAQFRPEKNHQLLIEAFATFLKNRAPAAQERQPKLVLIGSVRDNDDELLVDKLRLLARDLHIKDHVEFVCNAPWSEVLKLQRKASIGVNGMWNEHFGISVVEYQAAGLISVVNDSGGPRLDIVVDIDGQPTGFYASTAAEYAAAFAKVLDLPPEDTFAMRLRARKSAERFTEAAFAERWLKHMNILIEMQIKAQI